MKGQKSNLDHALKYRAIGWSVFPIVPKTKKPRVKWKPLQTQLATEQQITDWWSDRPSDSIGLVTGNLSGVDVVDLDGPAAREKFEQAVCQIPETIMQKTGRPEGGVQVFFKHSKNGLRNVVGKDENDGIDLRTTGGYVVLAPSLHKSGNQYSWLNIDPIEEGLNDLLEMPAEITEHFKKQNGGSQERKPITLEPVERGARNDTLTRLAGKWIGRGLDRETVHLTAKGWNNGLPEPLEDKEVQTIIESIFQTHERNHPEETAKKRKAARQKNIENEIIPDGLFKDYIDFVKPFLEAPISFSLFSLGYTISCILGRNCFIQQGLDIIFPNQFVLLVAPSSLYKKSTSIRPGFKMLRDLSLFEDAFIGHMGSPEGLMASLSENGTGFLYYSEFGLLLAQTGKKFMGDAIELLNDLYDCPDFYSRRLSGSKKTAENVYLNLIAATQLGSLTEHIKEQTLLSGFLPRFTVVFSDRLRPHIVRRPKPDTKLQQKIVSQLNQIRVASQLPCEMDLTKNSWERFVHWGEQRHRHALKASGKIQPFFGRLEAHCLKYAMIISKATDPNLKEISRDTLETAIKWAEFSLDSYRQLVMEELAFTDGDKDLKRLEDVIKKSTRVTNRDVANATKWSNSRITYNADILQEMGRVKVDTGPRGGKAYVWQG